MKRSRDESEDDMEWRPSEEESEVGEVKDELGNELIRLLDSSEGLYDMIGKRERELSPASLEAIEKGFRKNKSIKSLWIQQCSFSNGSLLKAMILFCKHPMDRDDLENFGDEKDFKNRIRFYQCTINAKAMRTFSKALAKAPALKSIVFDGTNSIAPRGWEFFFASLKSPQMGLRKLEIRTSLNDQGIVFLSAGLAENKSLRELTFTTQDGPVSDAGWAAFGHALSRSNVEHLSLFRCALNEENMSALATGLANSKKLTHFSLQNEWSVSGGGIREISGLLTNPQSKIEYLSIMQCALTDNDVDILSDSLKNNCILETLCLHENDPTLNLSQLYHILCNESSIESTYKSNHTLQHIRKSYNMAPLPQDLERLLKLNGNSNKKLVAAKKVFDCHLNGNFNLQPIEELEVKLWANVLGWVATPFKNDDVDVSTRLSAIFRLLRSKPALFGF